MRRFVITFLLAFWMCRPAQAQQAVLIEETAPVKGIPAPHATKEEMKRGSYLLENKRFRDLIKGGSYQSVEHLREERRVGVGVESFGRLGMVGLNVELNFNSSTAATVGVGGGPGYNSMSLGAKHVFGGVSVSPYAGFSMARWGGSSRAKLDGTTPGFLEDKFLTVSEKESGHFEKFFFAPSGGVQFNQLEGDQAGAVLFAEVLFLVETSTMDYIPTGAFGAMYFF